MDHSGWAHHARASRTPSAGGSNPAGRRHETYPAVIRDRQWRRELDEHHSAAVRSWAGWSSPARGPARCWPGP